jgi:hypothetical protein
LTIGAPFDASQVPNTTVNPGFSTQGAHSPPYGGAQNNPWYVYAVLTDGGVNILGTCAPVVATNGFFNLGNFYQSNAFPVPGQPPQNPQPIHGNNTQYTLRVALGPLPFSLQAQPAHSIEIVVV